MIVQRRYGLLRFASVENIPLQAERHSGGRQELFAFPLESMFAFRPECCSASQRNGVRIQTGIAFAFDRIPQSGICQKGGSRQYWPFLAPHDQSLVCTLSCEDL